MKTKRRTELSKLVDSLRTQGVEGAKFAFVLGSGLGAFADRIENAQVISYENLPGMPRSAVPGHAGKLVVGELAGVKVVCQQGRVHLYEGWSVEEVTRCVRAFCEVGIEGLLITNAAGGVNADWTVPTLMLIEDHLNCQGRAYVSPSQAGFLNPYDAKLGRAITQAAQDVNVPLERGVYAGLLGPTYETPAEVRMLRWMGASAVGMSTVNEAIAAHANGVRVAAISCITNFGAGITGEKLSHDEVVDAGKKIAGDFSSLLQASVARLMAALES